MTTETNDQNTLNVSPQMIKLADQAQRLLLSMELISEKAMQHANAIREGNADCICLLTNAFENLNELSHYPKQGMCDLTAEAIRFLPFSKKKEVLTALMQSSINKILQ